MSKRKSVKITCPKCKKESDFQIWESINVQIDPDMKKKVLNGEAFLFKCPDCGEEVYVFYSVLYHDMQKKMMIYLLPDDEKEIKAAAKFMSGTDERTAGLDLTVISDEYANRIVTSIRELQEKIYISDAGYDDRIIEIIKMLYLGMMAEQTPDKKVDEILFDFGKDREHRIVFIEGGNVFASAPVNEEVYNDVQNTFKERIDNNPNEYFIYDFPWARSLLK